MRRLSPLTKTLLFPLGGLYALLLLAALPPLLWLLLDAVTWTGRGLALAGLVAAALPASLLLWWLRGKPWSWSSAALIFIEVLLLLALLARTPPGTALPDSPVQHRFTTGRSFPTFAPTNVIPEAEQINLGFLLMPYRDRLLTREQARRVSDFTLEIYAEMEENVHFRRLGSAMGWAYAELVGRPFDVGHYYLYVPESRGEGPLPAIVFLHGSAGNFKAYTWVWSRLAEELGYAIIAPSYGFGNWRQPGGTRAVLRALEDVRTVVEIDEERLYLAGLSNGGLGVSELTQTAPERFRGLILISPVLEGDFRPMWWERPVLVVTGEEDRRVPERYIADEVRFLRAGEVDVTYVPYPDEDHFLFFSQPESVLSDVARWLAAVEE
jgi:pimeloyl-ACP methyl ester carboxylesterase